MYWPLARGSGNSKRLNPSLGGKTKFESGRDYRDRRKECSKGGKEQ